MSYLKDNAKYYLVFFDKDFNFTTHPYYSLPGYDKKDNGLKKLIYNILKRKERNNYFYAVIYDNNTGNPVKYYKNGVEVEKFNTGKQKLKLWVVYLNGLKETYTTIIDGNEQAAYWHLINKYIKAPGRRRLIKLALVYTDSEEIIGEFKRYGSEIVGTGKFHKFKNRTL